MQEFAGSGVVPTDIAGGGGVVAAGGGAGKTLSLSVGVFLFLLAPLIVNARGMADGGKNAPDGLRT